MKNPVAQKLGHGEVPWGNSACFFVAVNKCSETGEQRVPLGSAAASHWGKQRWRGRSTEIRAVPEG